MNKTLVLGIGNLLLSDDGVGIHAIRRLQDERQLPANVELMDGGTLGLNLLGHLEGVSHLLVVDAVEMNEPAGTLVRLAGEQVPAYLALKMSPHEIGLPDLLFAAKLRDLYPQEVVIWGIQPAEIAAGLELSEPVVGQLDALVHEIVMELAQWSEIPSQQLG
jgi:hydrogenase maturation protease